MAQPKATYEAGAAIDAMAEAAELRGKLAELANPHY